MNLTWAFAAKGAFLLAALSLLAVVSTLAVTSFEAFVLIFLLLRSSLEYVETSAPLGADLTVLVAAGFVAVAVAWLAIQQHKGGASYSAFARGAILFAGIGIIGVLVSPDPGTSAGILARIGSFVIILLTMEKLIDNDRTFRLTLMTIFASAVSPILIGLYQLATGHGLQLIDGFSRAAGTFAHPNEFAIYLTFIIVMGSALLLALRGKTRWGMAGLLVLAGGCLVGTYTRGAWIALVAGLVVVGLLHSKWILVWLYLALAGAIILVPSVRERVADIRERQVERLAWGAPENSMQWRIGHWKEAIGLANQRPVTGLGLGTFTASSEVEVHNDYIRAYTDGGMVGLLAYLVMIAGLLSTAWKSLRSPATGVAHAVAVGFAGCAVAFMLVSASDNVVTSLAVMSYFAAFAALATRAHTTSVKAALSQ